MISPEKDKKIRNFIKVCDYIKQFSEIENQTFLFDLVGALIFEGNSNLLDLLLNDEVEEFKKRIIIMNNFKLGET